MIVKHPTLPVEVSVSGEAHDAWLEAGWLPLLNDEQQAQLDEIQAEVETACPTCGAAAEDPCITINGTLAAREHAGRRTSEAATAADQGQHSDEGDQ